MVLPLHVLVLLLVDLALFTLIHVLEVRVSVARCIGLVLKLGVIVVSAVQAVVELAMLPWGLLITVAATHFCNLIKIQKI